MFSFFRPKSIENTQILKLALSGLHCSSCAVNIDLTLEDLEGVVNSKTNYAKSNASIDYFPEKTNPEKIIAEIEKLGYKVKTE